MHWLDWTVLLATLGFIVGYGVWRTRGTRTALRYLRGDNEDRWWAVTLSVMATQASAITFLSTPGQGFLEGMGFVQFYFGLPLAMVVIAWVFIPLYYKWNVYTAYEFIGKRFDGKLASVDQLYARASEIRSVGKQIPNGDWSAEDPAALQASRGTSGWPSNQLT